ncbi:MAG TPA: biotin/lipoyl-binding protein [Syntrophorhabdales bacterium]|nr:biotin/lipoyl-binding protein [Syntrophorhabdales bacterium]
MNRLPYRIWVILALGSAWISRYTSNAQIPENEQTSKTAVPLIHEKGRISVPAASSLSQSLHVALCEEQSAESPFVVPAVVEADPAKLVKVAAPVSGRIVQLYKNLGDTVRQGDALFTLGSAGGVE